ncbi:MAG: electron transfer flavoprotein-ubiquinone oxidoreductase [Ferrovum sp. 37-45-19]|nr:MAG: electron transfer flavoprotein-ubiquinone oxidoreductase [Ferrovum sp. 21-44-67]OYV95121.1 MAG: electron transfer flavoprotein-ubiquinone oxidoreductase [Ferrovum sp. 37-45-19]OZB32221.1 MAG: electron transfer flavoprotein-ubiquinone oxidoreductase [Ferrovum sp. 34-44-207]
MQYDVVIVGAGVSGLGCAIKLKQLSQEKNLDISVCVIEKGSSIGSHILSGAVMEPTALNELFPDWQKRGAPLRVNVTSDHFYYLTKSRYYSLPIPSSLNNINNFIGSVGEYCQWLSTQAEDLGVEIYPGFSAAQVIYNDNREVIGISTGDMGRDKEGNPTEQFQPGLNIFAKQTIFAEGARGSLTEELKKTYQLTKDCQPQTYALGFKEIWEVDPSVHQRGKVTHTVGWPLSSDTYGGGWIYHLDERQISIGFVVGLDYQNPYLNPFEEFQQFKTHPHISNLLQGGRRLSYGARALSEGGWQSIPKLSFPGGLLIGDAAGFLNVAKIKGSHTALKTGMLAAEQVFNYLQRSDTDVKELSTFTESVKSSWVGKELYSIRNIRPSFNYGRGFGLLYSAIEFYLLKGKSPWTFANHYDHLALKPIKSQPTISYPKADGVITFDKNSSVYLANIHHSENQPVHLKLAQYDTAIKTNYYLYGSPETKYCPAGVYEIINELNASPKLIINAQNCIHCKSCDIKDPTQNIRWVPPEGGSGPNYANM